MALIAGVDEVGRGCLFGPVVAAVVVVDKSQEKALADLGVTDSKKLSAKRRESLVPQIKQLVSDWAIASASVAEIDQFNILQATFLAMTRAVGQLQLKPAEIFVDGRQTIPKLDYPQQAIIQGDSKIKAIAAASILAKVHRDREMIALAEIYPAYDLAQNKGYGTQKHRQAIWQHGLTPHHRQSFKIQPPPQQLSLLLPQE
ncbi:ribonuclease HII [[Synechococcus] sp. NIES-970]|uniref:ribonuclease HII n=1 Tax=Picosynechococcus sp. NKBG15041c TaxID=1407650 RepID=UPI000401127C|nr:ribonuclease HII [Picosynechococcus sp. NKBG15041c]BAW95638.1 ribonuclease HII [[Synechococcus] sp. NIES-970]